MAKRYYNESEKKWYVEGSVITRKTDGHTLWGGVPTEEQLTEWGFVEYVEPEVEETVYTPTYEELVVQKIRERYTIDDELAILRQREVKPEEFVEYNSYCEQCKVAAREELGIEEEDI